MQKQVLKYEDSITIESNPPNTSYKQIKRSNISKFFAQIEDCKSGFAVFLYICTKLEDCKSGFAVFLYKGGKKEKRKRAS